MIQRSKTSAATLAATLLVAFPGVLGAQQAQGRFKVVIPNLQPDLLGI